MNVTGLPPNLFVCDVTVSFQFSATNADISDRGALTFQIFSPRFQHVLMDTNGVDGVRLGTNCLTNRIAFNDFEPDLFPGSHNTNGNDNYVDTFKPRPFGFQQLRNKRTDDTDVIGTWSFSVANIGVTPNNSGNMNCWRVTIRTSTTQQLQFARPDRDQ